MTDFYVAISSVFLHNENNELKIYILIGKLLAKDVNPPVREGFVRRILPGPGMDD